MVFSPEASDQLAEIYGYIARASGIPDVATRYTESIVTFCEGLSAFPLRGRKRDDVRSGLRVTFFKRRVVVAYMVEHNIISIIGVFYCGQDFESAMENTGG